MTDRGTSQSPEDQHCDGRRDEDEHHYDVPSDEDDNAVNKDDLHAEVSTMTMKKTTMKMMMMNQVINQMMLMLLMLMLMTKTTCMLRWLNRLTPSSLIASHSSEPSIDNN